MPKRRITQEEALALAYYTAQKAKANLEEDQEETQLKVTSEPATGNDLGITLGQGIILGFAFLGLFVLLKVLWDMLSA